MTNLELASKLLSERTHKGNRYVVGDTVNRYWKPVTTVLAVRQDGTTFQALDDFQLKAVIKAETEAEVEAVVEEVIRYEV